MSEKISWFYSFCRKILKCINIIIFVVRKLFKSSMIVRNKIFGLGLIALTAMTIVSCGGGEKPVNKGPKQGEVLKGFYTHNGEKEKIYAGGIFTMNEVAEFKSLFPPMIVDAPSHRIASQLYQGVVGLNQETLEVENKLAESVETSEDGLSYTIKLKKGIFFHDDNCFSEGKGREVTAEDIKYCFTRLCEPKDNKLYGLFKGRVLGADDHYNAVLNKQETSGVQGIEVVNDYEVKITLVEPFYAFKQILAHNACWIYPKEAYEMYGQDMRIKAVGTGAFKLKSVNEGVKVLMERNPNYWEKDEHGNQLPYLDIVKVTFVKEKKTELQEFRKNNLDMVYKLPVEDQKEVMGTIADAKKGTVEFQYQTSPSHSIQYYGLLHTSDIFKNVKVRKALNMAIDRENLVTYTLEGAGIPMEYGFVPEMANYDPSSIKGFRFNVDSAKMLLAEAGYPEGRGFPEITLQFNPGGQTNTRVAERVKSMLEENLGIKVKAESMPFGQLTEAFINGNSQFYRTAWIADYPDPESFLSLFYGKGVDLSPGASCFPNTQRYVNPEFDAALEKAVKEADPIVREELYKKCDQILIDDAAYLGLYYEEPIRLLGKRVRNFPQNAMEYRDLSKVFFAKKKSK